MLITFNNLDTIFLVIISQILRGWNNFIFEYYNVLLHERYQFCSHIIFIKRFIINYYFLFFKQSWFQLNSLSVGGFQNSSALSLNDQIFTFFQIYFLRILFELDFWTTYITIIRDIFLRYLNLQIVIFIIFLLLNINFLNACH